MTFLENSAKLHTTSETCMQFEGEKEMGVRSKWRDEAFDVVVVGGGMTGLCAALASAREGVRTALIHNRSVLGGNASSEIRMHICGADANQFKRNAAETGIIHEILLENKAHNDYYNYSIWDSVLLQTVYRQKGLTLFLNTNMEDADLETDRIRQILCYQSTTETHLCITGQVFIDCTGNGTLGYFAGADFRTGSEGRSEFQEPDAPEEPNGDRMGNTLLFKAVNRGHPVPFRTPDWVRHFSEDDLKLRGHGNHKPLLLCPTDINYTNQKEAPGEKKAFDCYGLDYGYWWIELPGKGPDIIDEYETIRDELVRCVYGVWDHLKNSGDHGAEDYDLQWVGMLPGIRESRRLMGDYILTENDVLANRIFPDAVAYGGWPIDNHTPGGLDDKDVMPSTVRHFPGLYTIPYRCYCSGRISNLMQAGRILSASKLAMASSRVMGTCSVGGQAAGTAAAMCVQYGCQPRQVGERIGELQQRLLRSDCYIPGFVNQDAGDLARRARAEASSCLEGHPADKVLNGVSRDTEEAVNCWESDGIRAEGETLTLRLDRPARLGQVRLTFDSNLNRAIKITLSAKRMAQQQAGPPRELVKDYEVRLVRNGEAAASRRVEGNYQRLNVLDFPEKPLCDIVEIRISATNGYPNARIFEVRAYE